MTHLHRLIPVALSLCFWGCGDGGGRSPATPAPPPLLPLSWNDVPGEITVKVGETETFVATLTSAIDAQYTFTADSEVVAVDGKALRAGVFEGSVTGVEAAEDGVTLTLSATHSGYVTATETTDVVVEDLFDENLWRELVFDAYDCPNGTTDEVCMEIWGERRVEQRITAVLPFQPNFHLVSLGRGWRFTSFQQSTIRTAIRAAVEQVTGERFTGQVTSGQTPRDQYGWVDVFAVDDDFYDGRGVCGSAGVGLTEGVAIINIDSLNFCDLASLTTHEVGHVLGFFHVLNLGDYIMSPYLTEIPPEFSESEQFHAQLGWELGRGAPYTPDPRKRSSAVRMAVERRFKGADESGVPLEGMVECPMH